MGQILPFKRPSAADKRKGNTLCRNNHHKWKTETTNRFDVKSGKLVTVEKCERCGKTRNRLT
ncbi:MAG TPA: hypothetical protein DD979_16480 [Gammaproteobacteria bacterium]|jgi:hypothetical protein|nr:hypothetical protein [Gammaproteobacteria bacterium]